MLEAQCAYDADEERQVIVDLSYDIQGSTKTTASRRRLGANPGLGAIFEDDEYYGFQKETKKMNLRTLPENEEQQLLFPSAKREFITIKNKQGPTAGAMDDVQFAMDNYVPDLVHDWGFNNFDFSMSAPSSLENSYLPQDIMLSNVMSQDNRSLDALDHSEEIAPLSPSQLSLPIPEPVVAMPEPVVQKAKSSKTSHTGPTTQRRLSMLKRRKTLTLGVSPPKQSPSFEISCPPAGPVSEPKIMPFRETVMDFSTPAPLLKPMNLQHMLQQQPQQPQPQKSQINSSIQLEAKGKTITYLNGLMLTKAKIIGLLKASGVFACASCPATFKVKSYLSRHERRHSKHKEFICPFFRAGFGPGFKRRALLGARCHPSGGFSRKDTYKTHLKAIHFIYPAGTRPNERSNVAGRCGGCMGFFKDNDVWLKHVDVCEGVLGRDVHNDEAQDKVDQPENIKAESPTYNFDMNGLDLSSEMGIFGDGF